MKRTAYHREWCRKHPGYKTAGSRLRAIFKPSRRAFYREILGIRVRVNLFSVAPAKPNDPEGSAIGNRHYEGSPLAETAADKLVHL
jgi:hypothetical protein